MFDNGTGYDSFECFQIKREDTKLTLLLIGDLNSVQGQ